MEKFVKENAKLVAWELTFVVSFLSFYVWGDQLSWDFSSLNLYSVFPLLGLLGFSLMWTHYVMWALRVWTGYDNDQISSYRKYTSHVVLACILLHPALIIYQLNKDGLGLPPESYANFVGDAAVKFIYLGLIAWMAFMLFEFKNKLSKKSWWKYVLMFNSIAMFFVVVHALQLGQHLQTGWFKSVWIGYGVSLFLIHIYLLKEKKLF